MKRQNAAFRFLTMLCVMLPAYGFADPMTGNAGGSQPHTNQQPSLGITHAIAIQGTFPPRNILEGPDSVDPFLGEIQTFGFNFAPSGWLPAEGQLLPISQHQSLFSLLGTIYGGDGRTTFGLPDLRGRSTMSWGTGPGLSPRSIGQRVGTSEHVLTPAEMAAHTHNVSPYDLATGSAGGGQAHNNMAPTLGLTQVVAEVGIFPSRNTPAGPTGSEGVQPFLGEIQTFAFNFAPRNSSLADGKLVSIAQNSALFSLLGTTYGGDGRTTFALPDLRGRVAMHFGNGPGLSPRSMGQRTGAEEEFLSHAEIPGHVHSLPEGGNTDSAGGGQAHNNMQPSLAVNYSIALEGTYPSRNGPTSAEGSSQPFLGEIQPFAFNFAPRGWALAEGQLLQIAQHDALFSLLGTTYGGDGRTTFALPDLRGRVPVHPNGSSVRLGQVFGNEDVTLTLEELPLHNHSLPEVAACDLNLNGSCGVEDLRVLYDDINAGTMGGMSDLDGNGLVNNADIDDWLSIAGFINGKVYLPGDANLDGSVVGDDFTVLAGNYGDEGLPQAHWDQGNFDGKQNGVFDVAGPDFSLLSANFGHVSVTAVPEPGAVVLLFFGMLAIAARRRLIDR